MSWPAGRKTVDFLLQQGRLETISSGQVEATAHGNLRRARRRLEAARRSQAADDPETAFSEAYDAYRMSAEALIACEALRASGGERGHMTVEDVVSAQFSEEIEAFSKPIFERFRRSRHAVQYFDPEGPEISTADAEWAVAKATDAVNGAGRLVDSGSIRPFE